MDNKILILGGGHIQLPVIATAKKMGLYTVVMDKNPLAPGFKICDRAINLNGNSKFNVYNVARKENVDAILPTGEYAVVPAAFASENLGLQTIGMKIAELATNKAELFQKFAKDKVPIAPHKRVTTLEAAKKCVRDIDFPIILKPGSSDGASRGVIKVNNMNELTRGFSYTLHRSFTKDVIVEKFLDGVAHSLESITINGKTSVLAISDKIRTTNKFCVDLNLLYPSEDKKETQIELIKAAIKSIDSVGIRNGICHVEAMSINGKAYVFDFGARGGASGYIPSLIVPNVCGINMMEKMISLLFGLKIGSLQPKYCHGVMYNFFHPSPGRIRKIIGINNIKKFPWLVDFWLRAKKGDVILPLSDGLKRPGFFVVKGRNLSQAKKRSSLIEQAIKIII